MISDYYEDLTLSVVTQTPDGGGGYTETPSTSTIRGFITVMSSYEQLASAQNKVFATARLFTEAVITMTSRITKGADVYEVVGNYNQFHLYYDLKKVS